MAKEKKGDLFAIIESLQIVFAGISFSLFLVVILTGTDFCLNLFRPDFVKLLSYIRISFVVAALIFGGFSGKSVFLLGKFMLQAIDIYKRGSKDLEEARKQLEEKENR